MWLSNGLSLHTNNRQPLSGEASVPDILGVPVISGLAKEGEILQATSASIVGNPVPSIAWYWESSADGSTGWSPLSYRENLLLQSNQFDTSWFTPNTAVTGGQSGYDGSSDAWLLEADTAASTANINQAVTISGEMTASFYAKEGTTNFVRMSVDDSGVNTRAWFDLSGSGSVGTTAGNITSANIESAGNGYFRCSVTVNTTAAKLFLFVTDTDGASTYSVGDNVYIQDFQLEEGLLATDYIESGATTGSVLDPMTPSYTVQSSDVGNYLRVVQTATNSEGSDTETSAATSQVQALSAVDADYQAILDYAEDPARNNGAAVYSLPSAAQQTLQNTLVEDLKTAGVWDKLDLLYIWATDGDSDFAGVNWVDPDNFEITRFNSPNFIQDVGFEGVTANQSYLSTGYIPSANTSANYTQDDASYGYYFADRGVSTASAMSDWGAPDGVRSWYRRTTPRTYINSSQFKERTLLRVDGSTNIYEENNTLIHTDRADADTVKIYQNGVESDDLSQAGFYTNRGLPAVEFSAFNRGSTYANSTLSLAYIGGSMTATEVADFNTAVQTYLNAI